MEVTWGRRCAYPLGVYTGDEYTGDEYTGDESWSDTDPALIPRNYPSVDPLALVPRTDPPSCTSDEEGRTLEKGRRDQSTPCSLSLSLSLSVSVSVFVSSFLFSVFCLYVCSPSPMLPLAPLFPLSPFSPLPFSSLYLTLSLLFSLSLRSHRAARRPPPSCRSSRPSAAPSAPARHARPRPPAPPAAQILLTSRVAPPLPASPLHLWERGGWSGVLACVRT
jgi:hypothetical protein